MQTYTEYLLSWIDEVEHQIDGQTAELSRGLPFPTSFNVGANLTAELQNNIQFRDDLCEILFEKTGRTYLDFVQERMDLAHEQQMYELSLNDRFGDL